MLEAFEQVEKGNYEAAARLLKPLAESGNPRAQCNLAFLYSAGLGVPVDGPAAVALYEGVAAKEILQGHLSAIACNNLATIYTTGLPGVAADTDKAGDYLERARKLGFPM